MALHLVRKDLEPNEDVIHTLRDLLLKAEAGQLDGFAFAALSAEGDYICDVAGIARTRPIYALGLCARLFRAINELI